MARMMPSRPMAFKARNGAAGDIEALLRLPPHLTNAVERKLASNTRRTPSFKASALPKRTAGRDRCAWRHGRGRSTGRLAASRRSARPHAPRTDRQSRRSWLEPAVQLRLANGAGIAARARPGSPVRGNFYAKFKRDLVGRIEEIRPDAICLIICEQWPPALYLIVNKIWDDPCLLSVLCLCVDAQERLIEVIETGVYRRLGDNDRGRFEGHLILTSTRPLSELGSTGCLVPSLDSRPRPRTRLPS